MTRRTAFEIDSWSRILVKARYTLNCYAPAHAEAIAERILRTFVNRSPHGCVGANRFRARDHWGWIRFW